MHCKEEKGGREGEVVILGGGWCEGGDPLGVGEWGELGMFYIYCTHIWNYQ